MSATPMPLAPVGKRIESIDIIRGFALAGILFANITWLSGIRELPPQLKSIMLTGTPADWIVWHAIRFFIHNKFYYLFAFLFGLGFAIQMERTAARKEPFGLIFTRRMGFLFVFGIAHALLFWWGDIVRYYAVFGLFLLCFRTLAIRQISVMALVCLALPPLSAAVQNLLVPGFHFPHWANLDSAEASRLLGTAGYGEWFHYNALQVADHAFKVIKDGRVFKIPAMFFAGMWVWRIQLFSKVESLRPTIRRWFFVCLLAGLLGNLIEVGFDYTAFGLSAPFKAVVREANMVYAIPTMSAAYLLGLLLFCSRGRDVGPLAWLAPLGQMSLTNYLLQTVFCTIVFRPFALDNWGQLHLATCALLSVGFLAVQCLASRLWLRDFRYGPVEWLWRICTYGQMTPLRRPVPVREPVQT